MIVAKKSPSRRRTLTLPPDAIDLLDELRGETPKSQYLEVLLKEAQAAREKEAFYARASAAYTPKICEETLALNNEFPIHTE